MHINQILALAFIQFMPVLSNKMISIDTTYVFLDVLASVVTILGWFIGPTMCRSGYTFDTIQKNGEIFCFFSWHMIILIAVFVHSIHIIISRSTGDGKCNNRSNGNIYNLALRVKLRGILVMLMVKHCLF